MPKKLRLLNVVGARPNFMKIAPLMKAYAETDTIEPLLVHTGQHYDAAMSKLFFDELEIPKPDFNLEVGSASHAVQTAEIMKAFEPILLDQRPDAVVVVGDVNSTVACGLVAVKLGVRLVHVEAGLRSFDRSMPEEINRIVTDAISDLLFCTERAGVTNLNAEGVEPKKVFLVGNLMVDTLLKHRDAARVSSILEELALSESGYAVLTLHRPSNVNNRAVLVALLDALDEIQQDLPIVLPLHPRTRSAIEALSLGRRIAQMQGLRVVDPLGYVDFLKLMSEARFVMTDSGGIQEETTILNIPCLTLRENTERPVTTELGTNRLVGVSAERIVNEYRALRTKSLSGQVPPLWDGHTAGRIVAILEDQLHDSRTAS